MDSFNIGRTLSRAFKLMAGTLPSVGLFVLAVQVVSIGIQYFMQGIMTDKIVSAQTAGDPNAAMAIFTSGWYWAGLALSLLLAALSFGGALYGLLQAANERPVSFADCLHAGVAKLLPVLGLTILWYLGVGIGWLLLIVPGMILITMWSVALPVLVGENRGILESFARSGSLTKGSRLLIFVTLLIYLVLIYVVLFVLLGALIGGSMMGMGMGMGMGIGMAERASSLMLLVMIPVGWLFASTMYALLTSLYLETSLVKEGGVTGHLAATFE